VVRFSAGSVEERVEEINNAALDAMIDKMRLQIVPRYKLSSSASSASGQLTDSADSAVSTDATVATVATDATESADCTGLSEVSGVSGVGVRRSLPAWDLAAFVLKVLRNSMGALSTEEGLSSLESKVNRMFRNSISPRMRDLLRPLESVALNQPTFLSADEASQAEELLNIGHEGVAAVFAIWQIRHNIVGVTDLKTGDVKKDYILPVNLVDPRGVALPTGVVLDSVPECLRSDAKFNVGNLDNLEPSALLEGVALLSHAVRETASH
jgi:hypothetical protein